MNITGRTRVCGIIGSPIEHTLSPVMHNAAFEEFGLDFVYVAFEVKKEKLQEAMKGVRALGIHGLNITIPHKESVTQFLDEISSEAKRIGSVNTVLNRGNRLIGYNTDGLGALRALEEHKVKLDGKKILLLGAGGAARAIAFVFSQRAGKLVILNRNPDRAKKLAETLRLKFKRKASWNNLSKEAIREELRKVDILINATPVGMHPKSNETMVDPSWLNSKICVFDIIYGPVETRLIRDAKKIGAKTIDGIDMLIHQGAMSFNIWTGKRPPIEKMRKAVLEKILELEAR